MDRRYAGSGNCRVAISVQLTRVVVIVHICVLVARYPGEGDAEKHEYEMTNDVRGTEEKKMQQSVRTLFVMSLD